MTRLAALGLLAAIAGCSSTDPGAASGQGPDREAVLHEVGGLLRTVAGEGGRPPRKAADLARSEAGFPLGYQAVQAGEVVVVWGARMAGEGDSGASRDVIAYEKNVPAEGGWVLLQNGTVKQMTAAEFAAAPKAR
jgi:hypothetical protein